MQKTKLSIVMGVLCPFLLMAQSSVYYRYGTYDGKGNTAFGLSLNSNGGTYNVGMGLNALGVNVTGIQNSELGLSFIQKLRPVTYAYKHDSTETIYTGFLAQEVEAAVVASGQKEFSAVLKPQHAKDHYSLRYAEFVVPLVKAVQQQQQIIDKQKEKIETLEQRLKALEIFVKKPVDNAMDKVELKAARPNPAKGQVQIDYYLPASATKGVLALFDVSGKRLQTHSIDATGEGSLLLDTKNLAAGVYIYTLQVDGKETVSQKMVVAAE
jgi:trimeric autotransporter adhesin